MANKPPTPPSAAAPGTAASTAAAASTLASKSITNLERHGVRNQIRSELIAVFNTVLKATPAQEIYLTEFTVQ